MRKKVSKAKGITAKLVSAIVISVVLAVSALLVVVYSRVSDAFLTKSEELLQATTGKTIQETSAWMNRTLTMLETQGIPSNTERWRHTSSTQWTRTKPTPPGCSSPDGWLPRGSQGR